MEHVIQGFSFQKSAEEDGVIEEENFDDVFGHGTNCIDCILQFAEQAQFYPIKIVNELGKTIQFFTACCAGKVQGTTGRSYLFKPFRNTNA